jgi:hypothetical protein
MVSRANRGAAKGILYEVYVGPQPLPKDCRRKANASPRFLHQKPRLLA